MFRGIHLTQYNWAHFVVKQSVIVLSFLIDRTVLSTYIYAESGTTVHMNAINTLAIDAHKK